MAFIDNVMMRLAERSRFGNDRLSSSVIDASHRGDPGLAPRMCAIITLEIG